MTQAVNAYGTLLKMGDGIVPPATTEVFTTIAEVKDIDGPGFEASTNEATNHSSSGATREWLAGMLDAGEVSFDLNFLPGNATQNATTGLLSLYFARKVRNFQLVWPNGQCNFKALVTGVEPSAPVDDVLTASVTLKVTGLPTFV